MRRWQTMPERCQRERLGQTSLTFCESGTEAAGIASVLALDHQVVARELDAVAYRSAIQRSRRTSGVSARR